MQHETTMMAERSQKCNEDYMCYVHSRASNHMTRHGNWFESVREPEILGYVQTGDNTTHTIKHVGDIPSWEEKGKTKYMLNVICSKPCKKTYFCWTDSRARNASKV